MRTLLPNKYVLGWYARKLRCVLFSQIHLGIKEARRFWNECSRLDFDSHDRRVIPFKLRGYRGPFSLRQNTSDFRTFMCWLAGDENRRLRRFSRNPRVIIDLGSNIGCSIAWFVTRFPMARVIGVEADPENFRLLSKNLQHYVSIGQVQLLNVAVWNEKATLLFDTSAQPWTRSVTNTASSATCKVEGVSVSEVMDNNGLDDVDFLKMDIEGAEATIFQDLRCRSWLKRVKALAVECHGEGAWRAFRSAIAEQGFSSVHHVGELAVVARPSEAP